MKHFLLTCTVALSLGLVAGCNAQDKKPETKPAPDRKSVV